MSQLTTFTGIATLTVFEGKAIIICAGDVETLKEYLGQQPEPGDPEICNVSITVGPRVQEPVIILPSMAGLLMAKAFAEKLGTRDIGLELTKKEEAEAKAAGLVVVFGASDDLAEFRGVIHDEVGCCDGGDITFTADWSFFDDDRIEEVEGLIKEGLLDKMPVLNVIKAVWCKPDSADWTYTTEIPHAKFTVMDRDDKYCEGIVFHISDLKK